MNTSYKDVPIASEILSHQDEKLHSGITARKAVWVEFAQIEAASVEKVQLQRRLAEIAAQQNAAWAELSKLECAVTAKLVLDARLADVARQSVSEKLTHADIVEVTGQRDAANAEVAKLLGRLYAQQQAVQAEIAQSKADAEHNILLSSQVTELTQQLDVERELGRVNKARLETLASEKAALEMEISRQGYSQQESYRTHIKELSEQLDAAHKGITEWREQAAHADQLSGQLREAHERLFAAEKLALDHEKAHVFSDRMSKKLNGENPGIEKRLALAY